MANNSIGAIWVKEGKKGKYLSGVIEINVKTVKFTGFKNSYKTEDKHPDYKLFPPMERTEQEPF